VTGVEPWWPSGDPAEHLSAMLKTVDWRGLRAGEPLHPELAARIRETSLWVVEGRTENPLRYGVGEDIEGLTLLDVGRAVLAWVTDPTDPALIDAVLLAARSCEVFGDLLLDDE
jgi:hypothetical protein